MLRIRRRASAASAGQVVGFDAFISYSHAVDGRLAPALQSGLHRFAKPWYRLRALRVFRDETSLSATPELWPSIVEALDRSSWFILLASPEAAKSKWVNDEVEHWCSTKSTTHVIVAVTKDDREGDFDWERTTSFPPALRAALEQEPRVVDLRWARDAEDVSLHNARFREAVADLAAPLHGRPKDELSGEDVRQHRRAIRLARSGVAALALLAIVAAVAAVLALVSRNREAAQARLATSRQLAAESKAALGDGRLDLALLLGAQSYRTRQTPEARNALFEALVASNRLDGVLHERPIALSSVSGDGRRLAVVLTDGQIRIWDLVARRSLGAAVKVDGKPTSIALSFDGGQLAVGVQWQSTPYLWDVDRRGWDPRLGEPTPARSFSESVTSLAIGRKGTLIAWTDDRVAAARVGIWNGRLTKYLGTTGVCEVLINSNASLLAALLSFGRVYVWRLTPAGVSTGDPITFSVERFEQSLSADLCDRRGSAAFSPTRPRLLAISDSAGVRLLDARTGRALGLPLRARGVVSSVAFSPDGHRIAARDTSGLVVWDVPSRSHVTDALARSAGDAGLWFGSDSSVVAAVGSSGTIVLSDIDGRRFQLAAALRTGVNASSAAFSADGTTFAMGLSGPGLRGGVRLWDVASRRPRPRAPLPTAWDPVVTFRPDGRRLAAYSRDVNDVQTVETIDVAEGQRVSAPVTLPEGVLFAGFGHDGRLVGVRDGVDGSRVWRPGAAGATAVRLAGVKSTSDAVLANDGRRALLATDAGVGVWDLETGRRIGRSIPPGRRVAWTKDEATIATELSDGSIAVWDARSGARMVALPGTELPAKFAFSQDGELLAVLVERESSLVSTTWELDVWDVAGRLLLGVQRLVDWSKSIEVFAFSPSNVLWLESWHELMLWDFEPDRWAETACRLAGRRLSEAEWERFLGTADYAPACSP